MADLGVFLADLGVLALGVLALGVLTFFAEDLGVAAFLVAVVLATLGVAALGDLAGVFLAAGDFLGAAFLTAFLTAFAIVTGWCVGVENGCLGVI